MRFKCCMTVLLASLLIPWCACKSRSKTPPKPQTPATAPETPEAPPAEDPTPPTATPGEAPPPPDDSPGETPVTPSEPGTPPDPAPADPATPVQLPSTPATGPAGTGDIAGVINWTGRKPKTKAKDPSADPQCVALRGGAKVPSERLIINANDTVKDVFIYVKDGLDDREWPVPQTPAQLNQVGCQYVPHVFGAMVGQPIQILNSDATAHNIHALPKNNSEFNKGQPQAGMMFVETFTSPEIMIPIKCDVHPWMSAFCGVLEHPFFAVSDISGAFRISGLPPGTYVIETWLEHPKMEARRQTVTVEADKTANVAFTYSPPQ